MIESDKDWHKKTQNQDYLDLSKKRLSEPVLIWVSQFTEIINKLIISRKSRILKINDIGCNVGHFARNIDKINSTVNYKGIDISDTYLEIAKNHFKELSFEKLDFSTSILNIESHICDLTIISATLEHIDNYLQFLKNVFLTTKEFIILRTFIGIESRSDLCLKEGALNPYLIRQFQLKDLINLEFNSNWKFKVIDDLATNNEVKTVCKDIDRLQKIVVFSKTN